MALLLIVPIIILIVGWFAWPRRASRVVVEAPAAARATIRNLRPEGVRDYCSTLFAPVTGYARRLRLPFRKDPDLAGQMGQWVKEASLSKRLGVYKRLPEDAAELTDWVGALSRDELADFARALSGQCRVLGFELAWLMDPDIPRDLRRSLEDPVILCCLATWRARDTRPLASFLAWQTAPDRPENRAFAHGLYTRLVEAGMVTPPAAMILAPDNERRALVTEAIRSAAAEHPSAFLALARDVVGGQPMQAEKTAPGS